MPQTEETERESLILIRVCVFRTNEIERESHILGGFACFEAIKQSVNHVFYEGLCVSKQ